MYKEFGFGLMGLFVLMMIPGTDQVIQQNLVYGGATLVVYDADNNEMFSQSVHNRLLDDGEELINDAVFQDTVTVADADSIGSICVYVAGTAISVLTAENFTATFFDTNNTAANTECQTDRSGVDTSTNSTAVIGPITFNSTGAVSDGQTIDGIGICGAHADDSDFQDCASETILFALVDTSDVTLADGETVAITYTFDLASGSD